jgi:hypothetical protein
MTGKWDSTFHWLETPTFYPARSPVIHGGEKDYYPIYLRRFRT